MRIPQNVLPPKWIHRIIYSNFMHTTNVRKVRKFMAQKPGVSIWGHTHRRGRRLAGENCVMIISPGRSPCVVN
jgi:hypothetical protein